MALLGIAIREMLRLSSKTASAADAPKAPRRHLMRDVHLPADAVLGPRSISADAVLGSRSAYAPAPPDAVAVAAIDDAVDAAADGGDGAWDDIHRAALSLTTLSDVPSVALTLREAGSAPGAEEALVEITGAGSAGEEREALLVFKEAHAEAVEMGIRVELRVEFGLGAESEWALSSSKVVLWRALREAGLRFEDVFMNGSLVRGFADCVAGLGGDAGRCKGGKGTDLFSETAQDALSAAGCSAIFVIGKEIFDEEELLDKLNRTQSAVVRFGVKAEGKRKHGFRSMWKRLESCALDAFIAALAPGRRKWQAIQYEQL